MRWKIDILAPDLKTVETTNDFVDDYAAEEYIVTKLAGYCQADRIRAYVEHDDWSPTVNLWA